MKNYLKALLKNKLLRTVTSYILILVFGVLFIAYWRSHPSLLNSLRNISALHTILLLALYAVFLVTNLFLVKFSVQSLNKKLALKELSLLTIYSTLVNFFGPLQSGPGYRAVYLKKKHGIKLRDFTYVSLLFYANFAILSVWMLFCSVPLVNLIALLAISSTLVYVNKRGSLLLFNAATINRIFFITLAQVVVVASIYYTELAALKHTPSITSILAYTGSANLALFVAITPAAIGIRESFILLTANIHGISHDNIIAASVVDRSAYFVFLAIAFAVSGLLHFKKQLDHQEPEISS